MARAFDVDEAYRAMKYLRDGFADDGMGEEAETMQEAIDLMEKFEYELDFQVGDTEESHE